MDSSRPNGNMSNQNGRPQPYGGRLLKPNMRKSTMNSQSSASGARPRSHQSRKGQREGGNPAAAPVGLNGTSLAGQGRANSIARNTGLNSNGTNFATANQGQPTLNITGKRAGQGSQHSISGSMAVTAPQGYHKPEMGVKGTSTGKPKADIFANDSTPLVA